MNTAQIQSVETACWSCGSALPGAKPFCDGCAKVQPPATSADYFEVFGLSRKLNPDLKALERAFYRLSRKLHPDMYAQATELEQHWSLEQTSLLNDAYRALKNPITRTEYLLKLEGVEPGSEQKKETPPDLLEEVFELNMQLEEMRMNQKMGEDDPQLRQNLLTAQQQFEAQFAEANAQLEALWITWDMAVDANDETAKSAAKEKMAALLDRRRYVSNLVRDVNEALGI